MTPDVAVQALELFSSSSSGGEYNVYCMMTFDPEGGLFMRYFCVQWRAVTGQLSSAGSVE